MITAKDIAQLREKTGLGMMECKKALTEADGDENKAIEILKKRGITKAASKAQRVVNSGVIEGYIHDGKIGVLVEVLTETDFVARNDDFKAFVHNLALHIAASNPRYVSASDIPKDEIDQEKKELLGHDDLKDKPAAIADKIIEGRMKKYYEVICLLNQPFIKDQESTINELLNALIAKIGEKIVITRFVRYQLGG